tara:strand:+ start:27046 stop:27831 length:786 start_codon:yes stop_codon:yes gene_type:complete
MDTLMIIIAIIAVYVLYISYKKHNSPEVREEKKRKRVVTKTWNRMWDKYSTRNSFFKFRMDRFGYGSYLSDIKKKYQDDVSLWEDYDKFLEETKRRESNKNKVNSDLNVLKQRITYDFNSNSYNDKISTTTDYYGEVKITYVFENGDTVSLCDKTLIYTTKSNVGTYTLGLFTRNEYVNLFNSITAELNKFSNRTSVKRPNNKPSHDHPKRSLYNTLRDTVTQREDQLRSGKYKSDNKTSLENELDNAKRKLKKIKDKYNF